MKRIGILLVIFLISLSGFSQNKYWVFFKDKKGTKFNPYEYFDGKALERRIKNNIDLFDSTDFPINKIYLEKTSDIADSVMTITRWFNGVSVLANKEEISEISDLPFVKEIIPIFTKSHLTSYRFEMSSYDSNLLKLDMDMHEANLFTENNIDGKGVRIAIFDAGFPGVDTIPVFEHIRKDNRIIKTYDFAKKKEFVYSYNSHGTNTFSCIAGMVGDLKLGMATGAEFLLARTEVNPEPFSEEQNWLAAAEWADKNGADIISSSLGYTLPRYFQSQMDGKSTLVARAAKMASDKGILVVNAMGNDGDGKWKVVGTPADVEEVLSVGGIDPYTNLMINFSSYGPTADGRMKPNVCAAGKALVASPRGLKIAYGTSFSTPLITGFAACVMQIDSSLSGQKLKHEIEKSASLYPYYDYSLGYGIPKASYFIGDKTEMPEVFDVTIDGYEYKIKIDSTIVTNIDENYFYFNFSDMDGKIIDYFVLKPVKYEFNIDFSEYEMPFIFKANFMGINYISKIKN